jgi:predicted ATP-grasp superfamily ATP-dependent carboligase
MKVPSRALRILVPEAQAMGSVACIRSLGRAGHHVLATAADAGAMGFGSRWCADRRVVPAGLDAEGFRRWLRALIDAERIHLVLPSEGLVTLLGERIGDFAAHLPTGPEPQLLERLTSKFELFSRFVGHADPALAANLPPTALAVAGGDWEARVEALPAPIFAKFDADPARGTAARVVRFDDGQEAVARLHGLLAERGRGVVQGFAPGRGVGVFFLRWGGQVRAALMHRRLHEVPHTGGVSSLRETWWDEALHADALARIHALDWWGVGMLEYRWNDADRSFRLMEFNARFWGSLHLALFAGVDFPRLLAEAWSGEPWPVGAAPLKAREGVRCRLTFPKEIEYLASLLRDPRVGAGRKVAALAEAVALSLDPRVKSDLWYPGDRGLYGRALAATPGRLLRRG